MIGKRIKESTFEIDSEDDSAKVGIGKRIEESILEIDTQGDWE